MTKGMYDKKNISMNVKIRDDKTSMREEQLDKAERKIFRKILEPEKGKDGSEDQGELYRTGTGYKQQWREQEKRILRISGEERKRGGRG